VLARPVLGDTWPNMAHLKMAQSISGLCGRICSAFICSPRRGYRRSSSAGINRRSRVSAGWYGWSSLDKTGLRITQLHDWYVRADAGDEAGPADRSPTHTILCVPGGHKVHLQSIQWALTTSCPCSQQSHDPPPLPNVLIHYAFPAP
jgi:hypothetical protein